jgi:hypothetical protein
VLVERVVVVLVAPGPRTRLADVVQKAGDAEYGVVRTRVQAMHRMTPHVERVIAVLLATYGLHDFGCADREKAVGLHDVEGSARPSRFHRL